ncbi:MAG: hypothetical protein E7554_01915 [Ruminococcaceae bacterium]|nr:hypothetical protein [Oscillospiraceae bacterium]
MIKAIVDGVRGATLRLQSAPVVGSVHIRGRHSDLLGRDAEGQHPISAIDGLREALDVAGTPQDIPDKLPNPRKIRLTGAVTAEYDGSEDVSVEIPSGGIRNKLLATFPNGIQIGGMVDLRDTGWEQYRCFEVQLSTSTDIPIGTGVLLTRLRTSAGELLRGTGGTGLDTGLDTYYCSLQSAAEDGLFEVQHCSRLVHTKTGGHSSFNDTNKIIAVYGLS